MPNVMRLVPFIIAIGLLTSTSGCGRSSSPAAKETKDSSSLAMASMHPPYLVGIWQWQWTDGVIDHVVLKSDGSAEKFKGTALANSGGTWRVDSQGMLQVGFPQDNDGITFRIDNEHSITDVETLPTDRDFPWFKVHKLTEALSNENIISTPAY
ncbi:hypothetical protein Poly51_62820 [Rubripirellula tenax]|uniref:Uncharacterized protein n=1 Tax=Rubripirellula tenax TaxID=2528015 RepID=A0A5C6E6P1_9BACT|nr:hypothetical protein [Rubripirellula tenax]TWU43627.1 hypothetical protein Poly51_62820 [Rubripirellula tenax]